MSKEEIISGILISIAFISLIVLFCILLVQLYIKKIKDHNLKELDFQKTLNKTIIETQEQVLQNISQDLHDDAGQQLTYINFQIENLKLDSLELQQSLAPVSESLGKLSQSIRSISHSLNNQLVVQQDLIKAISAEIKRIEKNSKINISLSIPSKSKRSFAINEKIIIYRIFQECVNNCLKHSKASAIDVALKSLPTFEMTIRDNGIGFDTMKKNNKPSLGILSMNSRAKDIGYNLQISSVPGKGTTITLSENKNT
jgi:signal transduction histidine kinase